MDAAIFVIHAAGLFGTLAAARLLSVPLAKAALLAVAFMAAGWALPWPLDFLPDTIWAWVMTSLVVSLAAAALAARLLGFGMRSTAAIVVACGLAMVVAAFAMRWSA